MIVYVDDVLILLFFNTNITKDLIIPYALIEIGSCAFAACYSLDDIENIALK